MLIIYFGGMDSDWNLISIDVLTECFVWAGWVEDEWCGEGELALDGWLAWC